MNGSKEVTIDLREKGSSFVLDTGSPLPVNPSERDRLKIYLTDIIPGRDIHITDSDDVYFAVSKDQSRITFPGFPAGSQNLKFTTSDGRTFHRSTHFPPGETAEIYLPLGE